MIAASHLIGPRWNPELWLPEKPNLHSGRRHHGLFLEGHRPPPPPGTQHDMPPQDTDAPDSIWGSTSMQWGTTRTTPKPVPRDLLAARNMADPTNATLSAQHCTNPHGPRRGPPTLQNSVHTPTPALSGDYELMLGA